MERSRATIRIDYPNGKLVWTVWLGHSEVFPIEKGARMSASVLGSEPPLDDTAYSHRPLWAFVESDPQGYSVHFERDGTCKLTRTAILAPPIEER